MGKIYTNVTLWGNTVLHRGVDENGVFFETRDKEYRPTLFVPSNKQTEYTTLNGNCVEPMHPGSIRDCKEFIEQYKNAMG